MDEVAKRISCRVRLVLGNQVASFWCELCKETSIEPEVLFAKTAYLRRIAKQHGGEFDGCQTPVKS